MTRARALSLLAKFSSLLRFICSLVKASWLKLLKYLASRRSRLSHGGQDRPSAFTSVDVIPLDGTIAASRDFAQPARNVFAPSLEARSRSENLAPTWQNASTWQNAPTWQNTSTPDIPRTMERTSLYPSEGMHRSATRSHPNLPLQARLPEGHTSVPLHGSNVPSRENVGFPPSPSATRPNSPTIPTIVHLDEVGRPQRTPPISRPPSAACSEATAVQSYEEQDGGGYLAQDGRPAIALPVSSNALPNQNATIAIHGQATLASRVSLNSKPVDRLRNMGIRPIDTIFVERYARGLKIDPTPGIPSIKPLTMRRDYAKLPGTWESRVHPEGILYYHDPERKVLTDANIRDPQISEKIERTIEQLDIERSILQQDRFDMTEEQHQFLDEFPSNDYELVLELPPKEHLESLPQLLCYYYYVSHKTRTLFWLNEMYTGPMLKDVEGVTEEPHLQYLMEADYWRHWEYFPLCRTVSEELLQKVVGIMMAGGVDQLMSRTSTFPYRFEDCKELIELVKNANFVKEIDGYSAWVVARLMNTLCETRFIHFHGQPVARMNRDQVIYNGLDKSKTLLITLLCPFFFFAPAVHLRQLEHVWADRVVNDTQWKKFIGRLQEEWQTFLLPATVLLGANVAFLAIPSVDQTGQSPIINNFGNSSIVDSLQALNSSSGSADRSFAQICSYISMVASTAAIIFSLILDRRHRSDVFMTAKEAAEVLIQRLHPRFGMELFAIIYSLPYVSLMWGMITFAVAVCALFFNGTTWTTRTPMSVVCFMFVGLTVWCLCNVWDYDRYSWREELRKVVLPAIRDIFRPLSRIPLCIIRCRRKQAEVGSVSHDVELGGMAGGDGHTEPLARI